MKLMQSRRLAFICFCFVCSQNLDEVHIALEVCNEPRVVNPTAAGTMPIPGKYSYIHKVHIVELLVYIKILTRADN